MTQNPNTTLNESHNEIFSVKYFDSFISEIIAVVKNYIGSRKKMSPRKVAISIISKTLQGIDKCDSLFQFMHHLQNLED